MFALLTSVVESAYVFTQLPQSLAFSTHTPQVRLKANLGTQSQVQQYSLWGWFRFNGEATAISNILTLRNTKPLSTSMSVEPYPNPKFPPCPAAPEEVKEKPELINQEQIANNPNCFPERFSAAEAGQPVRKENDLAFINLDLNNSSPKNPVYSMLFLNQAGQSATGSAEMKIEGFVDMKLQRNTWSFFAVSCDYVNGEVSIFFWAFNDQSQANIKTYKINFPEFNLSQNAELVIASVENNPYFLSTSGFIGDIGLIEMGVFYTTRLDLLWMGYLPQNAYKNVGVQLEFLFNGDLNGALEGSASLNEKYPISGTHKNLASVDPSRVGEIFYQDSKVELTGLAFKTDDFIKTMSFYLQFEFAEPLSDEFFIVQKGSAGQSSYFSISLVKKDANTRNLRVRVKGNGTEVIWNSSTSFEPQRTYKAIIGIALNPAGQLRIMYWDGREIFDFSELRKSFSFDFATDTSDKLITLFNNPAAEASLTGSFTFYRFILLNSGSSALYNFLLKDSFTSTARNPADKCKLHTSYYAQNFGCLVCDNQIANLNRTCTNFCAQGFKNGLTDICVPCKDGNCTETEQNFWTVVRISPDHYQLRPSRPLLNKSLDLSKLVSIYIPNGNSDSFSYTLVPNIQGQFVDIYLTFNENFVNKVLVIDVNASSTSLLYDSNRNIIRPQKSEIFIERACFLDAGVKSSMSGLAITALAVFLASFVVLVFFTVFFSHRMLDVGGAWKFFLHNWMKLQFVGLLYLLGVYMPCCAKQFLNIIYDLTIGWNHALGGPITNFNNDSAGFRGGMEERQPPVQFLEQGAFAFILHNMCIAFIIHLLILLTYLIVKIWDWFKTSRAYCMYMFFLFTEFTVLIVGYGLFNLQAFAFSSLNFRLAIFTHSYFVVCFIIAVCYLLVFAGFWVYAGFRLLGPSFFFTNPINNARFYYFFAGYRESKWARTFDLWHWLSYLVVGLMIGLLWQNARAQLGVILGVLIVMFVVSVILRPWNYLLQLVLEIVTQLLLIAIVIILLVVAIYDASGCFDCGNREGGLCFLLVALLFVYLMLLAVGLIAHLFLLTFCHAKLPLDRHHAFAGAGFAEANEKQFVYQSQAGMESANFGGSYAQGGMEYNVLGTDANFQQSAFERYHEVPVVETSNIHFQNAGAVHLEQQYEGEAAHGYDYLDSVRSEQQVRVTERSANKKTMLEFMNDVRRQREQDETDTFIEQNIRAEGSQFHGLQAGDMLESDFQRLGNKARALQGDKADDESMQEVVKGALAESKMVSLVDYKQKLEHKQKSFRKQKETFYDKSIKSEPFVQTRPQPVPTQMSALENYGSTILRDHSQDVNMLPEDSKYTISNIYQGKSMASNYHEINNSNDANYIFEQNQDKHKQRDWRFDHN